jgi:ABC-2 type transport system permease protein
VKPRRILADLKVFSRGYFRNPIALFFSLVFPIILIGLFGVIFSNTSNPQITVSTVNQDHNSNASRQFLDGLNKTGSVKVNLVNIGSENLSSWLLSQNQPVGILIPQGFDAAYRNHTAFNVIVFVNPGDLTSSGIVLGTVQGVLNGMNLAAFNGSPILHIETLQTGGQSLHYIDYLVPGLIGFSILTSPMFSMVDITSSYRKEGLFRQLSLTPLTKAEWLTSKVAWYVVLTFISAGLMFAIGYAAFGAHVSFALGIVPFLVLGPFLFVSLGMLAGSIAKTPESAAVIGNIITFPMMFLSGTFFPVSGFSSPLQAIAHVLPLYYVIDGMNSVLLNNNPVQAVTDGVIVLGLSIPVFVAAVVAFKWRAE